MYPHYVQLFQVYFFHTDILQLDNMKAELLNQYWHMKYT